MKTQDKSLEDWLACIAAIHPTEIALGLDRVKAVAKEMDLKQPPCPVVIVGGTNGKGSCVATLEKIYQTAGYRTGVFSSPILFRHNELLRIEGREAADDLFCEAYLQVEKARKKISLTPFEYHTLAIFQILSGQALDLWILEVGLGGRLDAVNIIDADVALVTSIGIDHVAWLGATRELIGFEKAGIFRSAKPVVCGDFDPPLSLLTHARDLSAPVYCQGKDFTYTVGEKSWSWQGQETAYDDLDYSQLAFQNLSTALMAVELLQKQLPVAKQFVEEGVKNVFLPGRFEMLARPLPHIFDVAHNPAAVLFLRQQLKETAGEGKTIAVFSMLADKDLAGSIAEIKNEIDAWYVAPLSVARAASLVELQKAFHEERVVAVSFAASVAECYAAALKEASAKDRILIFGSFHMVAEVKNIL